MVGWERGTGGSMERVHENNGVGVELEPVGLEPVGLEAEVEATGWSRRAT